MEAVVNEPALPTLLPVPALDEERTLVTMTVFTDPLCPWAYSFEPVLRTVEARYGAQLRWRTVLIGLVETVAETLARGSTAEGRAQSARRFRRFGMPITPHVRSRPIASGPACRFVLAARRQGEHLGAPLLRLLRFAWFTTDLLLDEADGLRAVGRRVTGLDVERALADLDGVDVLAEYGRSREVARRPSPVAVALRRTARSDGPERYTAPSLLLAGSDGREVVVPGFQPFEAVDVALVNLEPSLVRAAPPADVAEAIAAAPYGLTTQEAARVLADTTTPPDADAAESELLALAASGRATRFALGDDALWTLAA
mgnify:FL=1